jgi:hypothetical protein
MVAIGLAAVKGSGDVGRDTGLSGDRGTVGFAAESCEGRHTNIAGQLGVDCGVVPLGTEADLGGWACAFPGCGDDNGGAMPVPVEPDAVRPAADAGDEPVASVPATGLPDPLAHQGDLDVPAAGLSDPPGADDPRGIEALVCEYAWDCETALAVFWCESRFEAGAISKDGRNVGIAQTNVVHAWRYEAHGWSFWPDALDARKNLQVAYELYLEAGWRPWSCRP